jgi:hypothetical protein
MTVRTQLNFAIPLCAKECDMSPAAPTFCQRIGPQIAQHVVLEEMARQNIAIRRYRWFIAASPAVRPWIGTAGQLARRKRGDIIQAHFERQLAAQPSQFVEHFMEALNLVLPQ